MRRLAPGLFLSLLLHAGPAAAAADVTVFASASLKEVVEALAESFEDETGQAVGVTIEGSSALTRQSRRGPSSDIVITEDTRWMDRMDDGKAIIADTRRMVARNRLVLVARTDDTEAATTLEGALSSAGRGVIAIGDPSHSPGGRFAREALRKLGYWNSLKDRTTQAGDTREIVRFVQRRVSRYGIAYHSDAEAFDDIREIAAFPEELHHPIRYEIAITFQGQALNRELSREFVAYLTGPTGREILTGAGFVPCGDGGGC